MPVMTIDLSERLTARLRDLAGQRGRDLDALVEEAVRRYLDDAAITDVQPADVAATQEKLAPELTDVRPWNDSSGFGDVPETPDDATQ